MAFYLRKEAQSLLGELGIGRGEACELLRSGGRRLIWNREKVVTWEVAGWLIIRTVDWGRGEIFKEHVGDLCFPVWLHPADAAFCFHLVFFQKISNTSTCKLYVMFKVFCDRSITLEQLCIFKTSVTAELPMYSTIGRVPLQKNEESGFWFLGWWGQGRMDRY